MLIGIDGLTPLYDAPGDAGGGGGAAAGDSGSAGSQVTGGDAAASVKLDPNGSYDFGDGKPVKYSEWQARYVPKADYTRATQQAAERERQWKDYTAGLQRTQTEQQTPKESAGADFGARLRALSESSYVSGKDAAQIVAELVTRGIAPMNQKLTQAEQVVQLLYQKLQGVDQTVGALKGRSTEGDVRAAQRAAREGAKLPQDEAVQEWMDDIYYSHEGNDLNAEFPKMVATRWSRLVNAVRAWDKAQAQQARLTAPMVPGRGGVATPGKPLRKGGFESPEDIAKTFFPLIREGAGDNT